MSFLDIPAPHGRLEALLLQPEQPIAAALVCHPHPQHGGTMHNHLTYRIAQAFKNEKVAALRFNFRGVGRSTGVYDEGRGELEDARTAFAFLSEHFPGLPLYAAGFSFGSRVALQLTSQEPSVKAVLAVGLAVRLFDFEFVKQVRQPKAVIQSERDEYGSLDEVNALVAQMSPPKKLFVVPGADHLCAGQLKAFERIAAEAVSWILAID
jgi:alpha/beta superfamily hydrolase